MLPEIPQEGGSGWPQSLWVGVGWFGGVTSGCCSPPSCGEAAGGQGGVLVYTPWQQLGGTPVPPPHLQRGEKL